MVNAGLTEMKAVLPIIEAQINEVESNVAVDLVHMGEAVSYKADLEVIRRSAHLMAGALKLTGI